MKTIFSINTGRSGSHYLHTLFSHAEGVESFHEPTPNMQGEAMVEYNQGNSVKMNWKWLEKKRKIEETLKRGSVYVETNNAFIKGMHDYVVKDFPDTGVVWLRRGKADIVKSLKPYYGKFNKENEWLLRPHFKTRITEIRKDQLEADWYVNEVTERGIRYSGGNPVYEVWLDELNDYDRVIKMFNYFNLTPKESLMDVVGVATNVR